ncbi:hypothetical protein AB4043_01480 [Terriglobus sp. YAF25]
MDLKLKGKHALVTGGSAGIGLAIVKGRLKTSQMPNGSGSSR